jgi:putative membrane protein
MQGFLIRWFANIAALMVAVLVIPGINVDTWDTLIVTALVLGLVNAFLSPLIILFTLPLNVLSLGFSTLIINGFLFYSVSKLIKGFIVDNVWSAFWGAIFFSIVSFILNLLINPQGKIEFRLYKYGSGRKAKDKDVIDVEGKVEK